MPTHKPAVFSLPRLRRSLSVAAENRNAKRSKRAAFLRNLSLLLMSSFLTSTFCLVGCALAPKPKLPEVVGETPAFKELQTAVNANSAKIKTIFSPDASIGVASTPGWAKCQIAFERPGNLRVVASRPIEGGRVVDLGCNDERFWFWSDFQNSDELYFCRLDQYQNSAAAQVLPLDPTWFPEAFGVVELKEEELVDGPTPQGDGSLLVTTKKTRPDGVYLKRIYFEPKTAALLRQDVQAPSGETVVSIRCKRSVYLEDPDVVLPQKLEIECPRTNDSLIVDVGTPILNDSSKIAEKAFQQPTDLNAKAIDLGAYGTSTTSTAAQNAPSANAATPASDALAETPAPAAPQTLAAAPATFEAPQTQIRMVARARVEAAPQDALVASQTLAAAPTVATAQTLQSAPSETFAASPSAAVPQAPQTSQSAPAFQPPQIAQNIPTAQSAPAFQPPQVAQNVPTAQSAPTFQPPQVAQNAPTTQSAPAFQAPQVAPTPAPNLAEAPSLDDLPLPEESAPTPRPASTLEDFDALLPTEGAAPAPLDDFPSADAPTLLGPEPTVVDAPPAAL